MIVFFAFAVLAVFAVFAVFACFACFIFALFFFKTPTALFTPTWNTWIFSTTCTA
jgi:hypothetical protein